MKTPRKLPPCGSGSQTATVGVSLRRVTLKAETSAVGSAVVRGAGGVVGVGAIGSCTKKPLLSIRAGQEHRGHLRRRRGARWSRCRFAVAFRPAWSRSGPSRHCSHPGLFHAIVENPPGGPPAPITPTAHARVRFRMRRGMDSAAGVNVACLGHRHPGFDLGPPGVETFDLLAQRGRLLIAEPHGAGRDSLFLPR